MPTSGTARETESHYLRDELYQLVREDPAIFDFLQNGSLDGIWYWDLEKPEHEWMSPRFWEVFGYDPAEKPHKAEAWQDMIHPDDLKTAIDNFEKHCADADHAYDQLVRYRHKEGPTVWVRCRGLAIRDADGKPIRMLGAHTEITELKNAEATLQARAGELLQLTEQLEGRNETLDALQKIVLALNENLKLEDMYAVVAEEIHRLVPSDESAIWVLDEDGDRHRRIGVDHQDANSRITSTHGIAASGSALHHVLTTGEAVNRKDWSAETSFPVSEAFFDAGIRSDVILPLRQGQQIIGAFTVNARKPAAYDSEALRTLALVADHLSTAVRNALLIERLDKQQAELARSNKDLQHFAYVISHDLQEPVRMVRSFMELLAKDLGDDLTDNAREYLDFAVDGADRMRIMIDAILQLSRVGTHGTEFVETDLNVVFQDLVKDLAVLIEESGARLEVETLPSITCDPTQIRLLLQNLVNNAIKYRGEEAPLVRVSADSPDGELRIRIQDNGIGFDPKHMDRIFQIFQRLHTREEYQGTGIGLAICQKIAQRHGGEIEAESEPGKGSTFTLVLPKG